MSHHLIKRLSSGERFFHWLNMLAFIVLALTGLGLYSQKFFGLTGLFGGVDLSRAIHHYVGLVFIATTFIILFQFMRDYTAPGEDTLGTTIKSYLDPDFKGPPAGKFNAGQKLFGWCAFLFGVVMGITGLLMWFPSTVGRGLQQWMYFLHNFSFIVFMGFMMIHVYLGTVGVPGTWSAMSRGTVTKEWAKKNHPAWEGEEA
ncbi:MAG: formate dehydrogenase subunit gamma [bacterium]|nr:MAG: formate dehydrogenase subunit gamma [bacterium]